MLVLVQLLYFTAPKKIWEQDVRAGPQGRKEDQITMVTPDNKKQECYMNKSQ